MTSSGMEVSGTSIMDELNQVKMEYEALKTYVVEMENKYRRMLSVKSGGGDGELNIAARLHSIVSGMFNDPKLSDVVILLEGGVQLKAHKLVLAASGNDWGVEHFDKIDMLDLTDMRYEVCYAMMKWVYTDEFEFHNKINDEFLIELLQAASICKLQSLFIRCQKALISILDETNFDRIFQLSTDLSAYILYNHCAQLKMNTPSPNKTPAELLIGKPQRHFVGSINHPPMPPLTPLTERTYIDQHYTSKQTHLASSDPAQHVTPEQSNTGSENRVYHEQSKTVSANQASTVYHEQGSTASTQPLYVSSGQTNTTSPPQAQQVPVRMSVEETNVVSHGQCHTISSRQTHTVSSGQTSGISNQQANTLTVSSGQTSHPTTQPATVVSSRQASGVSRQGSGVATRQATGVSNQQADTVSTRQTSGVSELTSNRATQPPNVVSTRQVSGVATRQGNGVATRQATRVTTRQSCSTSTEKINTVSSQQAQSGQSNRTPVKHAKAVSPQTDQSLSSQQSIMTSQGQSQPVSPDPTNTVIIHNLEAHDIEFSPNVDTGDSDTDNYQTESDEQSGHTSVKEDKVPLIVTMDRNMEIIKIANEYDSENGSIEMDPAHHHIAAHEEITETPKIKSPRKKPTGRKRGQKAKGPTEHKCQFCEKVFKKNAHLMGHMRIHTGHRPFKCEICSRAFYGNNDLARHMRIHTGQKPYMCETCGKSFACSSNLKIHLGIHTDSMPFKCDICNKDFRIKSNLNSHLRIHLGTKPYKCEVCGKAYNSQTDLTIHNRIHTGEKPEICTVCNKAFRSKSNLKEHMRVHSDKRIPLLQEATQYKKVIKCDLCDKEFSSVAFKSLHLLTHPEYSIPTEYVVSQDEGEVIIKDSK